MPKTVDRLLEESQIPIETIAERAQVTVSRMVAIADGRWTPNPAERQRIADAFGVAVDAVSWGHSLSPRNIRYHRFGLEKDFL